MIETSNANQQRLTSLIMQILFVSFLVYLYIYFFPFNQGQSTAPAGFKALKDVILVGGPFLAYVITRSREFRNYLIAVACLIGILGAFFGLGILSYEGLIAAKSLLIPVVFAWLLFRNTRISDLSVWTIWVMVGQVIVSIFLNKYLRFGWEDGDMIGSLGNPNQFGLMCNLAIIFSLVYRGRLGNRLPFVIAILSAGTLLSSSLSQILIWICGMLVSLFWYRSNKLAAFGVLGSLFVVFPLCQYIWRVFNFRIFVTAGIYIYELVTGVESNVELEALQINSLSITGRDQMLKIFNEFYYDSNWLDLLTGAPGRFTPFDNQFITFAYNYGLLFGWLFTLILLIIGIVIFTKKSAFSSDDVFFSLGVLFCFVGTFMFTRVLYYYPSGLYFFCFIFWMAVQLFPHKTTVVKWLKAGSES